MAAILFVLRNKVVASNSIINQNNEARTKTKKSGVAIYLQQLKASICAGICDSSQLNFAMKVAN